MDKFRQRLSDPAPVVLDGGLATELERAGYDIDSDLWSAALLADNPAAIVKAHRAYLDAGAECIISASYQASRAGFMSHGYSAKKADAMIRRASKLAIEARDQFLADSSGEKREPVIAASVGPYGATVHDGSEYTGDYDVSRQDLCDFHKARLRLLTDEGADVLACETIPNIVEAEVLARLLEDVSIPAWVSFACRDEKHISDGTPLAEAAALFANHPNVPALGINCTPPQYVTPLIRVIVSTVPDKAIAVYPNSGETYHSENNSWSGTACDFEQDFNVKNWIDAGAKLIGGCCRTGPEHIAAIQSRLRGRSH